MATTNRHVVLVNRNSRRNYQVGFLIVQAPGGILVRTRDWGHVGSTNRCATARHSCGGGSGRRLQPREALQPAAQRSVGAEVQHPRAHQQGEEAPRGAVLQGRVNRSSLSQVYH